MFIVSRCVTRSVWVAICCSIMIECSPMYLKVPLSFQKLHWSEGRLLKPRPGSPGGCPNSLQLATAGGVHGAQLLNVLVPHAGACAGKAKETLFGSNGLAHSLACTQVLRVCRPFVLLPDLLGTCLHQEVLQPQRPHLHLVLQVAELVHLVCGRHVHHRPLQGRGISDHC